MKQLGPTTPLPPNQRKERYMLRVTENDYKAFQKATRKTGHSTLSAWMRYVLRAAVK